MENQYSKLFSEESLWEKIKKFSKSAGATVVYAALLLYYIMQDKNIPIKSKVTIAAALGYFIVPTDAIIDFTPIIGYTDDLGVLLFALGQVSSSITPEIRLKARQTLSQWFGEINEGELQVLEDKIV
ncbi:MAG: YkvA family protein [Prolixibacteraceae bacterium]